MFGLFGFDPRQLTDDELLDRVTELGKRILFMSRLGKYDAAQQLRAQKLLCEQEQRERLAGPRFQSMLNSPSVVVESDPDLAAAAKLEREAKAERDAPKKASGRKPFAITKERIKPTSRPTADD